ncbi:MAG: methyltransferase domain-containing protein [Clostridiales bacterium]|nr:methyltransferase domain-containing protein [Clostridiales bacterium]
MIRLDDLQIDNLKIYQDDTLYNFSTDAVLLANFVNFSSKSIVVDFCSGNGVVGILASSKNFYKKIYLIEIQENLAKLAQKSVEYNKLENIEVINDDLLNINNYIKNESVDVVMVNPPYRKQDNHFISENEHFNICNYEIKINLEQIINKSNKLLKFGGKLFMVNDINRLEETIILLNKNNFKVKTLQIVQPNINKNANVFLLQATKGAKSGIKVLPTQFLNDENGNYIVKVKKGKNER